MEKNIDNKILIILAHPSFQRSKFNKSLLNGIEKLDGVTINNLYEIYPDFMIDAEREQKLLKEHNIIVFHHPLYWYSSPAILKEWQDTVLEMGFAYGTNGNALMGKKLLSAVTTGQISSLEKNNKFREFLFPYEQTAKFCKMEYLPPFILLNSAKI
ncbi:MAG: NAD(P)H-dependent oxidoreductase, partial [Thermodesulfobacteriota bacterium]